MVPQQPPLSAGHRRCGPDELGGIRAQQNIRPAGDTRQDTLQGLRVALIILDDQINMTVKRSPDLQGPRRLAPEPRVPARQRQAHADADPVIKGCAHRRPSPPRSRTHDGPPLRWFRHLHRPVLATKDRAEQPGDRYPLRKTQRPGFLRCGHPADQVINRPGDPPPDRPRGTFDERVHAAPDLPGLPKTTQVADTERLAWPSAARRSGGAPFRQASIGRSVAGRVR